MKRYFLITIILMAVGLSMGFTSVAEMESGSSQSVTTHELVTCQDKILSALIKSSDRHNKNLNLVAQNIRFHRCGGSLIKFTAAEILTFPHLPKLLIISINTKETFKGMGMGMEGELNDNNRLTIEIDVNLHLPKTIIRFEDQNQRDEFIARLRGEEALRLEFSSSDDNFLELLDIRQRHVSYSIITVTPLKEEKGI